MRALLLTLALAQLFPGCPPRDPAPTPTPTPTPDPAYFRSSFDATLVGPPVRVGNLWHQHLLGEGWETELPQREGERNRLAYLTSSSPLSRYATAMIEDGALRMEVIADDPAREGLTRVEYGIYPPATMTAGEVRYRLRLQDEMPLSWRVLMEWRETDPDYRWCLLLARSGPRLVWRVIAQHGYQGSSPEAWRLEAEAEVPSGWFDLAVRWKASRFDGVLGVVVQGREILSRSGSTSGGGRIHVWWPMKLYGEIPRGGLRQWVDDIEFR